MRSFSKIFIFFFFLINIFFAGNIAAQVNDNKRDSLHQNFRLTLKLIDFQERNKSLLWRSNFMPGLQATYFLPVSAEFSAPVRDDFRVEKLNMLRRNNTSAYTSLLNNNYNNRNKKGELPYWQELGIASGIEILGCLLK